MCLLTCVYHTVTSVGCMYISVCLLAYPLTCFPAPHFITPTPDACGFPLILPLFVHTCTLHLQLTHASPSPAVRNLPHSHSHSRTTSSMTHMNHDSKSLLCCGCWRSWSAGTWNHGYLLTSDLESRTPYSLLPTPRATLPNDDISTPKKGLKRNPHVVSSTSRYLNEVDQLLNPIPFPSTASALNLFPRAEPRYLPETSRLSVHTPHCLLLKKSIACRRPSTLVCG